ncbi:hypothetical protein GUITHDRAFT_118129 [Guillardia theta CCMP2712]|uniref:Uncharacterized protein n=1 Tax=Guillardia theta (strain CCMP2712) TaxID=905079 RepID=L1IIV5_GUITC|nr:hypothetical protein GUITHDRAFT_118129 [Guillardia theta CCMP2712]EKX35745.1 hypothetical protein GUITHDRAFT_118129 [Guillardia theta CCMP2712]|eukprot:XP_005822725.1 hypothetical protein GUITHDRAFT_118129 [Guillardia theta CCMP2712]
MAVCESSSVASYASHDRPPPMNPEVGIYPEHADVLDEGNIPNIDSLVRDLKVVEAVQIPTQRRPSDVDQSDDRGNNGPIRGNNFRGSDGAPDPEQARAARAEEERERLEREIRLAEDPQQTSRPDPRLEEEEEFVKQRIEEVEERIRVILANPLGQDGLGRKKVWRVRPSSQVWTQVVGEKSVSEVVKQSANVVASGAISAVRGTAETVASGATTVASWSYKPTLWTAAEIASGTASMVATGAYRIASTVATGVYHGANVLVETVDEHKDELGRLQSELSELSDRLGAIDAKRTNATLKIVSPCEGSTWYSNHACNIIWEHTGCIQARGLSNTNSFTYLVSPQLERGSYCLRIDGPCDSRADVVDRQ